MSYDSGDDYWLQQQASWGGVQNTPAPAPAPLTTKPVTQAPVPAPAPKAPGATTTTPTFGAGAPPPAGQTQTTSAPAPAPAPSIWGGVQNDPNLGFGVGGNATGQTGSNPVDNWMAGTSFDSSKVPNDFNWQTYLQLNPALRNAGIDTEIEAKRNYALYGAGQNTPYSSRTAGANDWMVNTAYNASQVPANFDWQAYLKKYPDLKANGVDTLEEARKHYALFGRQEGRTYNTAAPAPAPGAPAPAPSAPPAQPGTPGTFQEAYGPMYADLLGKINAWANSGYTPYTGDRVAGPTEGQNQALEAAQNAQLPPEVAQALQRMMGLAESGPANAYNPMTFSSRLPGTSEADPFGVGSIESYMNPYVQQALDPQLREIQRQSDMKRLEDEARLSKAGAYGGSRQAILQGENNRNAAQLQSDVTGKGYSDAFNSALAQQLNASKLSLEAQGLTDKSNQFGASYGLDALKSKLDAYGDVGKYGIDMGSFDLNRSKQLADIGNTMWGIEQKGLDADYEMFKEERDDPITKLLTGIGALNSANSASRDPSGGSSSQANLLSSLSGILALLDSVGGD